MYEGSEVTTPFQVAVGDSLTACLIESIDAAAVVADESGNIVLWNAAAERILGRAPFAPLSENWPLRYGLFRDDRITPLALEQVPICKAIKGEACRVELLMCNELWPLGIWVECSASPIQSEDGSPRGAVAIFRDITVSRQALSSSMAEEERARLLLSSTAEGIYELDLDGNCTFCNPSALQLLGYEHESAVLGKNMHRLIHHSYPDGRPRADTQCCIYQAFRQSQGVHRDDEVYWTADGEPVSVEYSSFPIFRDGRIAGAVVVFRDISERKRAQEALQLSEERFRAAFARAAIGMAIVDSDGRLVEANDAFSQLTGYSNSELRNLTMPSITFPEDVPNSLSLVESLVKGQAQSHVFEKRYVTKSGGIRWAKVSLAVLRSAADQPVHIIALAEDTTERHAAEQALANNAQQLQALFDNALDSVVIMDSDGRFLDVNAAACTLFKLPKDRLIGRCGTEITETTGEFLEAWQKFLQQGTYRGHHSVLRPSGERRWVDVSATANFLPGRHLAIVRDITEQHELETQLRQAQKMEAIGRLAGGIAHDFNNLLNVISGFGQLLEDYVQEPKRRYLEEVMKAARRAAALTRQLLAFSRKQILAPKVLDLNATVAEMSTMISRVIGEHIELRLRLDPSLGKVKADESQLEQVLVNLVINARDAMPSGGHVTIETRSVRLDDTYADHHPSAKPGDYVMLAVTDSGIGMSDEVRSRIFEPFYTTKETGKGTGLGLATVYGIVKQSGGWIWVYSEVGLGTVFKIYLPLVEQEPAPATIEFNKQERHLGTETVLLVEDEDALRQVGKEYLESCGYQVLEARNGSEALEVAEKYVGPIHILVTDVVMPKLGGRDLARRLVPMRPDMKVVYVSGYTEDAIVDNGILDIGVVFLQKPYSLSELSNHVRCILDGDDVPNRRPS